MVRRRTTATKHLDAKHLLKKKNVLYLLHWDPYVDETGNVKLESWSLVDRE
jgi:hypothetical protein